MIGIRKKKEQKSFVDNYRHKGMRQQLVRLLQDQGITDKRVLDAIRMVPRHFFLDSAFEERAYENRAFPIDAAQTISHPYTVAFQSQLLEVLPGDKVLEIGTGSGYQSCILAYMGAKVYSIERQEELFNFTSELLPRIGFRQIRTLFGDGYKGAPRFAPFDKIIVTAGATDIPKALLSQLAIHGKMVIPVGDEDQQKMILYTRDSLKSFRKEEFGAFSFVPFLKGVNKGN
ncbi:protein-L-isoaspartate(D-aspartate) O-methyltransferase [Saprospiraceae bacterium]|nr:protein-L-isoaspartate(D-aspartate) O-methyltransferase [Saprospiraceae bacterium]